MNSCEILSIPDKGRRDIFGLWRHIPIKLPSLSKDNALIMLLLSTKKDLIH